MASELPFGKDYQNKPYPFVRTRGKKTKEYFLNNSKALYSLQVKGLSGVPYALLDEFHFLRSFASGMQSEDRYKNWMLKDESPNQNDFIQGVGITTQSKGDLRKGYTNIFFDIVSPAPKILATLVGKFSSVEYDISADPIDYGSKQGIENAKIDLWATKENQDFLRLASSTAGIPMQEPDFMPESREEIELYEILGGFKPNHCRIMETVIKKTLDVSYWLPTIKDMLYRDLVTLGMCGCRDYYDPEDGLVKSRYVDPSNFGIQWSKYPDHRDSEYAYEFIDMSISSLRQYFSDRDESFFEKIAYTYSGYAGNLMGGEFDTYKTRTASGGYGYDSFKVCVGDFEWIDIDGGKEVIKKNVFGREISESVAFDKDVKETENKKVRFTEKRMRYGTMWVVGTDEVFEWGKCYDVTRPTKKEASLSFHFYNLRKIVGRSIVQQLVPIFDNFQMLWLKYQNSLAMAVNDGYDIDVEALMNLGGNDTPQDMKQAVKRFFETGINFYKRTNNFSNPTGGRPIEKRDGGMGKMFEDIIKGFAFNISLIENITGLNPVALGQTPNPNAPVTTTEMSVTAMASTLKPHLTAYSTVKKAMSENITRWAQIRIKTSSYSRKAYASVLSPLDVEILKASEGDNVSYGITLNPRPTDTEKQTIYQQVQVAMQVDRDGKDGGINISDGLALTSMLESGASLKVVEMMLADRIRRNMKAKQKARQQDMQLQNQITQSQIQAKAQADKALSDDEHGKKMQLQDKVNEGMMGKTVAGEEIKKKKEESVAHIKTGGQEDKTMTSAGYIGQNGMEYSDQDLQGIDINRAVQSGKLRKRDG
jgi:hypothetical protein